MSERKEQWVSATSKYDDGYQHGWHNGYQNATEEHAATIATQSAQIEGLVVALKAMREAWLDYHDRHSLTEPVTGRAGNAMDLADAALSTITDAQK